MRLAVAVLLLLVTGCGAPSAGVEPDPGRELGAQPVDGKVQVVASMSILADFGRAVGGEHVEVTTLVPIGADPHTYEPVPSAAASITDADVVVRNGAGLETWLDPLLQTSDTPVVTLTDGLVDEIAQEEGGRVDPHLWMVPVFAQRYVTAVRDTLAEVDPEHTEDYQSNADAYLGELAALDAEIMEQMATIPADRRNLVTSHDAYRYFADHYGLEVTGTVLGVTTEEEPSARAVRELVERIRAEDVPTIFLETTVNPAVIEQVAREADVEVGEPLYGDSVGEEGSEADDYLGMMRANAQSIVTGLGGEVPSADR